jgi:hypothetical protein
MRVHARPDVSDGGGYALPVGCPVCQFQQFLIGLGEHTALRENQMEDGIAVEVSQFYELRQHVIVDTEREYLRAEPNRLNDIIRQAEFARYRINRMRAVRAETIHEPTSMAARGKPGMRTVHSRGPPDHKSTYPIAGLP